jgi:hypothetical protein
MAFRDIYYYPTVPVFENRKAAFFKSEVKELKKYLIDIRAKIS